MPLFQGFNRGEIRRAIGRLVDAVIIGEVTTTGDTTSLIDTLGLRGGNDEHNGKEVLIYTPVGSIVAGEKSRVTDYDGTASDATVAPAFTANVTDGDKYEMWEDWLDIEEVNDLINQQIIYVSPACQVVKVNTSLFTQFDTTTYPMPSGFTALATVDYVKEILIDETIGNAVWTGATDVTASEDTTADRGHICTKLTVAGAVAAGAQLGYVATTGTLDLSKYTYIQMWIRSSIAQTAANLELLLCTDTAGATAVDTLSLPALTARTWTRVELAMDNPELDTAIASIALKQKAATDVGACIIWVEYVVATLHTSRVFKQLSPEYWKIINPSTTYLQITRDGLSVIGNDRKLRLTGYQLPTMFSSDAVDSDVDPGYLINAVAADILMNRYRGQRLDTKARGERAARLMAVAERLRRSIITNYLSSTRLV